VMSSGNIPETLRNLTNLESLSLAGNQLSGTYPRMSRSAYSKSLVMSSGNLPETLGNRTNTQQLVLSEIQPSGTYPMYIQICALSHL
jgi:Leucine-rich repeat (LRR) protein